MNRTPLYLDFENGKVAEMAEDDTIVQVPQQSVNSVVCNTSNTDPATYLGYGSWSALGSLTVGVVSVYFFQRTD